MTRARSIIFTHVPRTAGSSMHYAFLQAIGSDRAHVLASPYLLPQARADIDSAYEDGQVYLGGHFALADVARLTAVDPDETVNFCTLRDPLERFLSHHALIQSSAEATDLPALRPTSITEFVTVLETKGRLEMINNLHCVTLCGAPDFNSAREAILDNYDFVAVSSRADDLLGLIVTKAGNETWPGGSPKLPEFPHNAVAADQRAIPTDAELALLDPLLAEDRKLIDWVRQEGGLIVSQRNGSGGRRTV